MVQTVWSMSVCTRPSLHVIEWLVRGRISATRFPATDRHTRL